MEVFDKSTLPRERLQKEGAESLATEDLIALILGRGTQSKDVFTLSKELAKYLSGLARRPTLEELCKIGGLGRAKASQILACLELSSRFFLGSQMKNITSPSSLVPHLAFLKFKPQECFVVVSLSSSNGILGIHIVTEGLVNRTQVHAREVFAVAIKDRASGIIVAHNHPSGSLVASDEDKEITRTLFRASRLLEIPLMDHLIISFRGYVSIRGDFSELFRAQ